MNAVYAPFDNFQTDAYDINDGRINKKEKRYLY